MNGFMQRRDGQVIVTSERQSILREPYCHFVRNKSFSCRITFSCTTSTQSDITWFRAVIGTEAKLRCPASLQAHSYIQRKYIHIGIANTEPLRLKLDLDSS